MTIKELASPRNRGILLDVVVLVLNLLVTRMMTRSFMNLCLHLDDDPNAQIYLGLFFSAMVVLPMAGAVIKRWHYHQRKLLRGGRGNEAQDASDLGKDPAGSCLFNPIFYFCLSFCVAMFAGLFLFGKIFGEDFDKRPGPFLTLLFSIITLSIVQTVLVYRYFTPPKKAPRSAFLRDPRSELLGDACLYLNMLLFQVVWNVVTFVPYRRLTDFEDLLGRLFFISFAALLIYFPPRIFYLADDIHRRSARITILLANAPVILRILL
ncbi:MAG: hypothetical protein M3268_07995 [Acidobacteriota bacterium]|nr:hypothetical protein [Acidobacteriota bacterium]